MIRKVFLFCLLSLMVGNAFGQTASITKKFPFLTQSNVLIQPYKLTTCPFLYYKDKTTNKNVFVYHKSFLIQNINYKYELPLVSNFFGPITYTVNDMKIVGDVCYFCGIKSTPTGVHHEIGGGTTLICDEEGYVGRLLLDSVDAGYFSNVRCNYTVVNGTSALTKMDILVDNNDTLIGLIGRTHETPDKSCLVSMKGMGSGWSYKVYPFIDTTEVLTDIAIGGKVLVTASRFGGDNYSFGVRYSLYDDFFYYGQMSQYHNLNKYNTSGMTCSAVSDFTTWHRNNATIRLIIMPGSNDVTVAHESLAPGLNSWVTFYYISYASGVMQQAATSSNILKNYEVFYAIKPFPYYSRFAILLRHPSNGCKSALHLFSWNNYSSGICIPSDTMAATSMYITDYNYICTAGNLDVGNGSVYTVVQDATSLNGSCYYGTSTSFWPLAALPPNTQSVAPCEESDSFEFAWTHYAKIRPEGFSYEITCRDIIERTDTIQQLP